MICAGHSSSSSAARLASVPLRRAATRAAGLLVLAAALAPAVALAQKQPRVVAPDDLPKHWVLINASVQGDAPMFGKGLDVPTCAAVSFVVEGTGRTSTVKLQRIVPEGPDLAKLAVSIASHLQFEPSVNNGGRDRVFSWLIFPLNLPADPAARSELMKPCAIERLRWADR
ncbi:TonB family protein [Dokdonella koreensis DS-123]|uniref:TonB family protein n=1 Tax=Dokdonella koreensis DS-123 TaxID=1300342 RepID=A0A167GPL0_9GAMM|nr:TonB family protein [Dokdonella koreensis DS-123]